MMSNDKSPLGTPVNIDYTNYKGERRTREIWPICIVFGATDEHPEDQWLIYALDTNRGVFRTFAMKNIHSWTSIPLPPSE